MAKIDWKKLKMDQTLEVLKEDGYFSMVRKSQDHIRYRSKRTGDDYKLFFTNDVVKLVNRTKQEVVAYWKLSQYKAKYAKDVH